MTTTVPITMRAEPDIKAGFEQKETPRSEPRGGFIAAKLDCIILSLPPTVRKVCKPVWASF